MGCPGILYWINVSLEPGNMVGVCVCCVCVCVCVFVVCVCVCVCVCAVDFH